MIYAYVITIESYDHAITQVDIEVHLKLLWLIRAIN